MIARSAILLLGGNSQGLPDLLLGGEQEVELVDQDQGDAVRLVTPRLGEALLQRVERGPGRQVGPRQRLILGLRV